MNKTKKFVRGTEEHKAFLRSIGLQGGLNTKKNQLAKDPDYYHKLGQSGFEKRVANLGGIEEFRKAASAMGKKGSKATARKMGYTEDE